jgi:membrane protease YdiL (CAAX protease family)
MAKNYHVVPHDDGWAIKQEGADGLVSVHTSQAEAVKEGEHLAADREVNLIVHREDGAFDHVENFREGNGKAAAARGAERGDRRFDDEPVRLHDVASVGSRVSWSALLAGAVVALTVYIALGTLGVAIGLSTAGVNNVDGDALAIGAAIWAALSLLISLFLGGFVTSRSTVGERKDESMIYGLLLWGTIFVAVVVLTAQGMNLGVGGMLNQVTGQGNSGPILTDAQIAEAKLTQEQVATLREAQSRTDSVRATTAAWWTFATLIASIIASIAGALVGAGPQLSLEHLRSRREAAIAARA